MHLFPVDIFVRSGVIYCFILLVLRAIGKRHLGQMTPLDFVLLLLISNAVQNAMTGPDTSVIGGMVAALTLTGLNLLFSRTMKNSRTLKNWMEGSPTILIYHGEVIQPHLVSEGIDEDELLQALRAHGAAVVQDVHLAVLERDGSISVIKNEDVHGSHTAKPYHRIKSLKRH